ncbi:glycosyltransferase family 2 protein [Gordonia hankookensis]|uniref:Glycosyltransferase family 2 protein n=1 Tax=Gordonia hankookensis TaxID=589403 RepID=A0ABR7W933_9ACTN|nr:glycosyltransferase family 2 protein [Gordonia hankookensis]MBD1319036.1 glycosyltransferase family 2 protein [Gordonia hankookensis]
MTVADELESASDRSGPGPEVSVIMITYNAAGWTQRSLAAVGAAFSERNYELIILDNASTSLDRDELTRWAGPRATVVFSDTNLGFGPGCNRAVERARGRYLLFLNPDAVMEPRCGDLLVRFLEEDPRRGIVGGRITAPDGELDYGSCWGHQTVYSLACFASGLSTVLPRNRVANPEGLGSWQRDSVRQVGVITGCLMLMTRQLFEDLGGFDERFFMYGEDADLCWRAGQLGYRPSITPDARAVHAIGASSASVVAKQVLLFRGKATLITKRSAGLRLRIELGLLQTGVFLRAVLDRRFGVRRSRGWNGLWQQRAEWRRGW